MPGFAFARLANVHYLVITFVEADGLEQEFPIYGFPIGFNRVFDLSSQSFQIRYARYRGVLYRKHHCLWHGGLWRRMDLPESGSIRKLCLLDRPLHSDGRGRAKPTSILKCERCEVLRHVWRCLSALCDWVERRLFLARRRRGPLWRPVRMVSIAG